MTFAQSLFRARSSRFSSEFCVTRPQSCVLLSRHPPSHTPQALQALLFHTVASSWLSFSASTALFSVTYRLFCQNRGVGGPAEVPASVPHMSRRSSYLLAATACCCGTA